MHTRDAETFQWTRHELCSNCYLERPAEECPSLAETEDLDRRFLAAKELMRQFVDSAPDKTLRKAVTYLGKPWQLLRLLLELDSQFLREKIRSAMPAKLQTSLREGEKRTHSTVMYKQEFVPFVNSFTSLSPSLARYAQYVIELPALDEWEPYGMAGAMELYERQVLDDSVLLRFDKACDGMTAISEAVRRFESMSSEQPCPLDDLFLSCSESVRESQSPWAVAILAQGKLIIAGYWICCLWTCDIDSGVLRLRRGEYSVSSKEELERLLETKTFPQRAIGEFREGGVLCWLDERARERFFLDQPCIKTTE